MTKIKNSEINADIKPKGVANSSKKIKKTEKKVRDVTKGTLKGAIGKNALLVPAAAVSVGNADIKKNNKASKQNKAEQSKVENEVVSLHNGKNAKVSSEMDMAKIEKKRNKKKEKKAIKKQNKAGNNTTKEKDLALKAIVKAVDASMEVKKSKVELKKKKLTDEKDIESSTPNSKKVQKKQSKIEKLAKDKISKDQERGTAEQKDYATIKAATVFVGNLPTNTKRIQVIKLFSEYAPIQTVRFRTASGDVIFKHKIRQQAGTLNAYVQLKDEEMAKKALALNGIEFKGNHLRVMSADTKCGDPKHMLFVGNLKYTATEDNLREIFSSCGEIEYVRCLRDGKKGCNGVAYVCFKAPEAVGLALELNGTVLNERPIHVERYSVNKLGAKEERDSAANAEKITKTGAKRRLDSKKPSAKIDTSKGKKNSFRGVKVGDVFKKKAKKKTTSLEQQLAKKIAPKVKAA